MVAAIFVITLFILAGGIVARLLLQRPAKDSLRGDVCTESKALNLMPPDLGSGARNLARQRRARGKATFATACREQGCDAGSIDPLTVFSVAQALDTDYAILWKTQVPALQLLDAAGPEGVPARKLYRLFVCFTRLYPEFFENSTFRGWLQFLERERLLTRIGKRVFITTEGHYFFEFISSRHCEKSA